MKKHFKAYMTVEGSFIFSMILGMYYLVIVVSITLFAKCIDSQKDYLKAFYDSRFTIVSEDVSGVIYVDSKAGNYIGENGMTNIDPLNEIYGRKAVF